MNNRPLGENALRGFAELFLRKGAGRLHRHLGQGRRRRGARPDPRTRRPALRRPRTAVARALRDFRAAAVARLPDPLPYVYGDDDRFDAEGQRQILPILYSFMFLYFGHPLTTLRLSVRAQEART